MMNLYPSITAVFVMLLLTSCSPPTERHSQLDDFDFQGHRGAMGMFAENTIPSFLLAIDEGVTTIEFDIVVTADDELVVSHEPWFRHTICLQPDGSEIAEEDELDHQIYEMTYEEVSSYDCGSLQNPDFPEQQNRSQPKPTMRQAIEAMEGYVAEYGLEPVHYSIETKARPEWDDHKTPAPETFTRLMYEELVDLDVLDRVIMQSFDPRTLRVMRELDEEVRQALLISGNGGDVQAEVEDLGYTPEIYSPHYLLVSHDMVQEAHEMGMQIIPWTINDVEDMKNMVEMGVDGLITDYPNRFNSDVREMLE